MASLEYAKQLKIKNFSEGEWLAIDAKKNCDSRFSKIYHILDPTVFDDISIVSMCLHLKKWIWEDIYCRERVGANEIWNGKWGKFETENGEQSKIYKKGTNITYLPLPPFKIKSNCNLWILSDSRRLPAPVWHNMYITSKTLNLQFC